ncbi:MAG: hypothetical protein ACFCD0_27255 [Gemmataceae bacterium]
MSRHRVEQAPVWLALHDYLSGITPHHQRFETCQHETALGTVYVVTNQTPFAKYWADVILEVHGLGALGPTRCMEQEDRRDAQTTKPNYAGNHYVISLGKVFIGDEVYARRGSICDVQSEGCFLATGG